MGFIGIIWSIAIAVVGELLRPKQSPPNARASGLDDLEMPTAEEGRALYAIAGKVRLDAPNVVWYGDLNVIPITKKVKTGWFSSARQTIGHQYKMGIAFGLCFARPDIQLHKILWGSKEPKHTRTNEANGTIKFEYYDPYFYGGETAQGGVGGIIRVYTGTDTQESNAYMTAKLGEEYPAYRGFMHAVAEQVWWGNTAFLKPLSWEISSYPNQLGVPNGHHIIDEDANPICMIYELMTEPVWAAGNPTSDLNVAKLLEVAETIYSEGLGISMVYSGTGTAKEYIAEILRHIDGVMFTNPATGLVEIALARGGYDPNTLPVLTKDDFDQGGIKFGRPSWEETKNTIKTTYIERSKEYTTAVISMQDLANITIRGEVDPEAIEFTGFSKYEPAAYATARALKTMSYPLASIEGRALKISAGNFLPAGLVRVYWPELGLNYNVFRITEITYPGVNTNVVPLKMVEDIFSVSDIPYTKPQQSGWDDPSKPPVAVARQKLFELPIQFTGNTGMTVATLASRTQGIDLGYRIWSGSASGDVNLTYKDDSIDWTPSAIINVAYPDTTADVDPTGFTVTDVRHGDEIPATVPNDELYAGDSIGLISSVAGDELVAFKNFTGTAFTNILRGVYGTGKLNHPSGATFWVLSGGFGVENQTPYSTLPRTVYAKLLTFNPLGELAIGAATQMSLALTGKASIPGAPRYVTLNGNPTPPTLQAGDADATVAWEWKDVRTEGGRITSPGTGSDPLPSGWTFVVRRYVDGVLVQTTTGLTAFNLTYTGAQQESDSAGTVQFRVHIVDANGNASPYSSMSFALVSELTLFALNFNGTNGSTTMTDIAGNTFTSGGGAVLDTAYGVPHVAPTDASLAPGATGFVSTAANPRYNMGTKDFTVEGFVTCEPQANWGSGEKAIVCLWNGSTGTAWWLGVNGSGNPTFYFHDASGEAFSFVNTVLPTTGWIHLAATRQGNTLRIFINGVQQTITGRSTFNGAIFTSTASPSIAVQSNSSSGFFGARHIDSVRVSKNIARYTANFTPPTPPFVMD